jgi:hypothetical protein
MEHIQNINQFSERQAVRLIRESDTFLSDDEKLDATLCQNYNSLFFNC